MGTVPLSLHVTAKVMTGLEREARLQNVTTDDVAKHAIRAYLDAQEHERNIMRRRNIEADKGVFISGEAMAAWVDSWGTNEELPPPAPDVFPPTQS